MIRPGAASTRTPPVTVLLVVMLDAGHDDPQHGPDIRHAQGQQLVTSRGRVLTVHNFDNPGPGRDAAP
ncbi:MAG: hypothetical protein ACRDUV_00290 [Pseudonocardiaceae bacterium]